MLVEATRLGYYNLKRVKPGEVFQLKTVKGIDKNKKPIVLKPEDQFSESWMKKVEQEEFEGKPKRGKPASKSLSIEIESEEDSVI